MLRFVTVPTLFFVWRPLKNVKNSTQMSSSIIWLRFLLIFQTESSHYVRQVPANSFCYFQPKLSSVVEKPLTRKPFLCTSFSKNKFSRYSSIRSFNVNWVWKIKEIQLTYYLQHLFAALLYICFIYRVSQYSWSTLLVKGNKSICQWLKALKRLRNLASEVWTSFSSEL